MPTKRTFFIAAATLVLAACTQKENPMEERIPAEERVPVEERIPVALAYTTVQGTAETKAAQNLNEDTFATDEDIKVRISNTGANQWTDYTFTTAANGAMTAPDPAPYYPEGSQNIDIVAYYPATAGTSFTVAADQTEDEDYMASDLMFASVTNQAKQTEAVGLEFSHKMAKINVNITPGTGVTSISSVSILNVFPTVTFDPATGEVGEASGTATDIVVSSVGAALIPAQTLDGGLLSIETDMGTATYSVPAGKTFEAGKQYTINLTVNLRNLINGHAFVDMGEVTVGGERKNLLWATCNLGATKSWEYGDYFQWGAIEPYYTAGHAQDSPCENWIDGKTGYNWLNYPFIEEGIGYDPNGHITKYYHSDGLTSFADDDYADDAARQLWGGAWRMPTHDELEALSNTGTFEWLRETKNGIEGMRVTRIEGPCAGNNIFLPAAGSRYDTEFDGAGAVGIYWSSSLSSTDENRAWSLTLQPSNAKSAAPSFSKRKPAGKPQLPPVQISHDHRSAGYTIRPVAQQ